MPVDGIMPEHVGYEERETDLEKIFQLNLGAVLKLLLNLLLI